MLTKVRSFVCISAVAMATLFLLPAGTAAAAGVTLSVGTTQNVAGLADAGGIACPSATTCYALGYNQSGTGSVAIIPIVNGVAGNPVAVSGVQSLNGIACGSASSCVAVGRTSDTEGAVVTITNGTPGTALPILNYPTWNAIACPNVVTCVAVGPSGVLAIAAGVPATPVAVSNSDVFGGVSCESTTTCLATGEQILPTSTQAISLVISTVLPGSVQVLGLGNGSSLGGVDCVSTTTSCLSVGTNSTAHDGLVVPFTSGSAGAAQVTTAVAGLSSLGCAGAGDGTCVASGFISSVGAAVLPLTGGVPGAPTVLTGVNNPGGLACPSAVLCVATGEGPGGATITPITVIAPLAVATTSLAAAQQGSSYTTNLAAVGGHTPYTWTLASGALPPGLTLKPTGVISGTPSKAGTYSFTVEVTDSSSPPQTATAPESITVSATAVATNLLQVVLNLILGLLGL